MIPLIIQNKATIDKICKKYRVSELFLFGSAVSETYDPTRSHIDLAVRFDVGIPVLDMADHYFGFIEELEQLFQNTVDIVSLNSVKNWIFKEELERTMIPLYAA